MPWTLSSAQKGKCILEETGRSDPLGAGGGVVNDSELWVGKDVMNRVEKDGPGQCTGKIEKQERTDFSSFCV